MASNVDMSLDDIVMLKKKNKGSGKQPQQKQHLGNRQNAGGNVQNGGSASTKTADLRKLIAQKQKANITDLRTKLKPKALYTSKYASKQGSISQPATPKSAGFETRNFNKIPRQHYKEETTPNVKPRSRRSDPGPLSSRKPRDSPKLPTYEDAKKITVTVPGTRSTSASEVR